MRARRGSTGRAGGIAVALGLALLAASPAPGHAQYPEAPRRPSIRPPTEDPAALAREAEAAGIPTAESFLSGAARVDRSGVYPVLVIPALFSDSPDPHVTAADLQRHLFDGPSPQGTIGEFYGESSRGLLELRGTVTEWVRTSVTLFEGAGEVDGHGQYGERLRDYVREAIRLADESVDFGQFDNDGPDGIPNSGDDDGIVDGLAIDFLEVAGSCGGPGIWPHLSGVRGEDGQPVATDDLRPDGTPVRVSAYLADSVVDCEGTEMAGPEVLAHELGHFLGLPDWYRAAEGLLPEQRHWNVGCFDLMGGGAWGCGDGGAKVEHFGPTGLSALSRAHLGWIELERVGEVEEREFVLEPVLTSGRALEVPLTDDGTESLIIEYRTLEGFDDELPAEGVLVYHRDTFQGPRQLPPGSLPPYSYHLVEADGDDAMRLVKAKGGNRGVAADVWARDGAVDSLSGATYPSTRDHLGRPTTVTIHSMRVEGGVARVVISTRGAFAVASREYPRLEATRPFTGVVRVAGAQLPLEVEESPDDPLPDGVTARVEEDRVVVEGRLFRVGPTRGTLLIRDAAGNEVEEPLGQWVEDLRALPEEFIALSVGGDTGYLNPDEVRYLDESGNADGVLDVGDLRAFLIRTRLIYRAAPPPPRGR